MEIKLWLDKMKCCCLYFIGKLGAFFTVIWLQGLMNLIKAAGG